MDGMDDAQELFVAKVDAFATTLEPEEQAMLIELLVGDDEVSGFGVNGRCPGLVTLGFSYSAGTNPDGVSGLLDAAGVGNGFDAGRTDTGFVESGGGSQKV